ncbi:MAG: response regulator [Verrucomicrobiota bacterium]
MISVAIVEDTPGLRRSLELLLSSSTGFCCVGTFASAEEALIGLPKNPPEVVLMDIHLPNLSGIECTARLREVLPQVQVIIITVYADNDKIFKALRAGARGYLLKRSSPDAILQAITDVRQGGAPMTSAIARKVVEAFSQPVQQPAQAVELSRREQEVLELISEGHGDKEIAARLAISFGTVRFHLNHIYEKLHVRSRTAAVRKFSNRTPASIQSPRDS